MRRSLAVFALLVGCPSPVPMTDAPAPLDAPAVDAPLETDAPVAIDAPSSPDAPSPLPLPYYEVPTSDSALAPHAFFAVPDVHYVRTGGTVVLTYDFPPDLSGVVDQPIELSGPVDAAGNATVSGPAGTGTCVVSAGVVRCTETFSAGLLLDTTAARALTSTYPGDAAARAARTQVIDLFASDPIGIVVFDLATASEPTG